MLTIEIWIAIHYEALILYSHINLHLTRIKNHLYPGKLKVEDSLLLSELFLSSDFIFKASSHLLNTNFLVVLHFTCLSLI